MYVCVCHGVTEDDVRTCMTHGGAVSARDVKAACGLKPGCGSCTRRLYGLISEVRTASELVDAIAGPAILPSAVPDAAPAVPAPAPLAMPAPARMPVSRWLTPSPAERGSVSAA